MTPVAAETEIPKPAGMVLKTIADDAAAAALASTQWVIFRCAGEDFGLPLDPVREILTPRPFTRLPGAGPEVCGLAGVRGRVVTVVDLGVILRAASSAGIQDHRLLLLDVDDRVIGVAVDEVVMIAPALVVPLAERGTVAPAEVGTGRTDEGAFVALDPIRLLGQLLQ
jgi:purine-binding chemotaxis protein CheW